MSGGYAARKDGQGWRAVDGEFPDPDDSEKSYPDPETEIYSKAEPPPPVALPPTKEELIALANIRRDELLTVAALRINPLQDAVDLDDATDAEIELMRAWKRYRVALNRLPEQPGYPDEIEWPAPTV